jgi:drug/metabolite transporter (DMT)-like permease
MEPMPPAPASRTLRPALYTAAALVGFAANSLLGRAALGAQHMDAASFTSVRLGAGAVVLSLLAWRAPFAGTRQDRSPRGSWPAAVALFVYAAAFSFAYLRLSAGAGALILFAAVQATMIGWGMVIGHERPRPAEWLGMIVALGGMGVLAAPGLSAHDPVGIALITLSGIAWGIYSLLGRGATHPLAVTAANFVRSAPLAFLLSLYGLSQAHASRAGVALAVASGGIASGIGYSLWYAALPHIPATRAAILQLSVPVIAAAGGIVLLGEPITLRLGVATVFIVAGVGMALVRR